jgi:hypothetical protein
MDLADPPERLQMAGKVGPPHRDADAIAALGEHAHHMATEKARAAKDGDQRVDRGCGHAALFGLSEKVSEWDAPARRTAAEYRIGFALYRGRRRRGFGRGFDKAKGAAVPIAM